MEVENPLLRLEQRVKALVLEKKAFICALIACFAIGIMKTLVDVDTLQKTLAVVVSSE